MSFYNDNIIPVLHHSADLIGKQALTLFNLAALGLISVGVPSEEILPQDAFAQKLNDTHVTLNTGNSYSIRLSKLVDLSQSKDMDNLPEFKAAADSILADFYQEPYNRPSLKSYEIEAFNKNPDTYCFAEHKGFRYLASSRMTKGQQTLLDIAVCDSDRNWKTEKAQLDSMGNLASQYKNNLTEKTQFSLERVVDDKGRIYYKQSKAAPASL